MKYFQVGNPVTGSNLIGRENEIKKIITLLKLGQSVALVAPRRFGKTSIVMDVLIKLSKEKHYTAYVDVFSSPSINILSTKITEAVLKNHKLDRLFLQTRNSAVQMIKNLKIKAVVEDFEFILGFAENKKNDWGLLDRSIGFINGFAVKHQKKMICAFDEFGDIKKLNGQHITKLFRSHIQKHYETSYLFSGSYESIMNEMFVSKNAPFHRLARIINLGFISRDDFLKHFENVFKRFNIEYDENYCRKILSFTKGHPYNSQLALQEIILSNIIDQKTPTIEGLKSQMLLAEKSYLEKAWENISARKENTDVIIAIVMQKESLYGALKNSGINISRSVRNLQNDGTLLRDENNDLIISDPLLEYWIIKNIIP